MTLRCDGKKDCLDGTDESECKSFVKSLGYNKFLVPPPPRKGGKQIVYWNVSIIDIVEINEIQNFVTTKIGFTRTWFDSQLTFLNVKKGGKNTISFLDRETIWRPWIIFQNIANNKKIIETDKRNVLKIVPKNGFNFTIADDTFLYNTHLFDGADNALQQEEEYSVEWLCEFHMEWYPFDTQSCTMQFRNDDDSIDFLPSGVTYTGPRELPQHYVWEVKVCSAVIEGDQGIIVEVILGRPLFSSFLTSTLPTSMLIIISQMATSFSEDYFDMVIQVNLTVLLVLATL